MHWITLLGLALGLGADAMSVSMAVGVRWNGPRQTFRLAWHMGMFQALMPLLGFTVGRQTAELAAEIGPYLAAGLVFAIGGKMLYEAIRQAPGQLTEQTAEDIAEAMSPHHHDQSPQARRRRRNRALRKIDPTRGWSLLVLSVATSIDALVVGFSAGLRGGNIWVMVAVIGLTAAAMSLAGVLLARRIGKAIGKPAEIAGALILMVLAVSFLVF